MMPFSMLLKTGEIGKLWRNSNRISFRDSKAEESEREWYSRRSHLKGRPRMKESCSGDYIRRALA
jgi:hypothetical protein